MTPEQIAVVRATWALALQDGDVLAAAVAAGLSGTAEENAERARWAVGSITRLVIVLDRPADFVAAAHTELARLPPFTLEGLGVVRTAVLASLRRMCGDLPPAEERAWDLAFALFAELVAAQHLAPFHPPTTAPPGPPAPTSEETRSP